MVFYRYGSVSFTHIPAPHVNSSSLGSWSKLKGIRTRVTRPPNGDSSPIRASCPTDHPFSWLSLFLKGDFKLSKKWQVTLPHFRSALQVSAMGSSQVFRYVQLVQVHVLNRGRSLASVETLHLLSFHECSASSGAVSHDRFETAATLHSRYSIWRR